MINDENPKFLLRSRDFGRCFSAYGPNFSRDNSSVIGARGFLKIDSLYFSMLECDWR